MGNGVVLWRVLHRAQRRPKAFYKIFLRGADNGPHPPPSSAPFHLAQSLRWIAALPSLVSPASSASLHPPLAALSSRAPKGEGKARKVSLEASSGGKARRKRFLLASPLGEAVAHGRLMRCPARKRNAPFPVAQAAHEAPARPPHFANLKHPRIYREHLFCYFTIICPSWEALDSKNCESLSQH
jgi:hypothetical protein